MEQHHIPFHATILTGAPQARRQRGLEMARALVCSAPEGPDGSPAGCAGTAAR